MACWKDDRQFYREELKERFEWLDKSKRVRQMHMHPKHIPFAGSRYWDYGRLLFDYVPGPKGTEQQVIARQDIELNYVSPTFAEMLAKIANDLESGKLKVTSEGE